MNTGSVTRKVAVGAAWLFAWRMVTRALGVVSTLIMARLLAPADFGILAMATTFAATIDSLSQFGVQEALIRSEENSAQLHDTAFTFQVARAIVTAGGIALCAPVVSEWFQEPRLFGILLVLAAASAVSGLQNIGIVSFRRDIDYARQFAFLGVPRLLQVGVTITLGLILHSYWALVVGNVALKLAQTILSYGIHPYRPRLSLAKWRTLASFSFWTWASCIGGIIWNRCDPFVIGPAVGAAELGVFLLAIEIASLPVTELVAPVAEVLFSGFSIAQRQGTDPVANALPVAVTLLLVIMPMILAVSGTSGYIVASLLGPEWTQAAPLVAVAAFLGLFSPFSWVCNVALTAANRVRTNFIINIVASVVKLLGLLATVRMTTDLLTITIVSVLIVGAEAAVFILALSRRRASTIRPLLPAMARLLACSAATLALMWFSGLAWPSAAMPSWRALCLGATLGLCIMIAFAGLVYAGWLVAGRPEGPETKAANLMLHLTKALKSRLPTSMAGPANPRTAAAAARHATR